MNRQYQVNDVVSAVWGHHQIKFGADVIFAHTGGNSKEFGGPIYLGMFSYNPCTLALAVCESPTYLNNIANVKSYTQSYGNANYTVERHSVGDVRAGRLEGPPEPDDKPGPSL